MITSLSILGSTGSIGLQALEIVRKLNISVCALAAHSNISLLEAQAREFKPKLAAVFDEDKAKLLKTALADTCVRVVAGMDGLLEAAVADGAEMVLNSVVGMVGLRPTLAAINAKKNIALANKETLVAGGSLVTEAAKRNGVELLPVDSEHSAVFQCFQALPDKSALKRIILTASGGPFFGRTADELKAVTAEQALSHPVWNMGAKITIDSATMMNKGLEIIEAAHLFALPSEKIDVVIHRESIIHSMIECTDNAVLAQLGVPDMRIPIQYAFTYPQRLTSPVRQLDLTKLCTLSFYNPDYETFLCLKACVESLGRGGLSPAAANGANEEANKMFREGKISFLRIGELVYSAMKRYGYENKYTLDDVLDADKAAREYVVSCV